MMVGRAALFAFLIALGGHLAGANAAWAHGHGGKPPKHEGEPKAERSPGTGNAYLWQLGQLEDKLTSLLGAFSDEQLTWAPQEGVRNVGEAFLHTSQAQYFLLTVAGAPTPDGVDIRELTKQTGRTAIIGTLKRSFAHLRNQIESMKEADWDASVELFGKPTTKRQVLLKAITHTSEHLGQLIGYARMNGVVPPWSAKK